MDLEGVSLAQICRTCKCVSPHMRFIFGEYENPQQSPRIDEMLMACASVQVMCGDGLPTLICQVCLEQLRSAFIFKLQCEKIDANLREYAKNVKVNEIKEELEEEFQNSDSMESPNTLNNLLTEQESPNEMAMDDIPLVTPKIETDYIQYMDNNQMMLTCQECAKTFTTLEALCCHKRIHAGGMYKCKQCDKEYTRLNHLHRHEQTHSRRKMHVCKICNKTLTRIEHLKRHLMTHLREKPFSCKMCNRGFNRIEHLHNHIPRCKGDTIFSCDICNRPFKREDSLEVHKKMHDNQAPKLPTIENLDNFENHYYQIYEDENVIFSNHSDVDDCFKPQVENMENIDEEKIKEVADISSLDKESNVSETLAAVAVDDNDNDNYSSVEKVVNDENLEVEKAGDQMEVISEPGEDDDDDNKFNIVKEAVDQDSCGDTSDSEYLSKKIVSPKVNRGHSRSRKNPNAPPKRGCPPPKSIKKEKDEEHGKFPCPACQEVFYTIIQLDRHARQKHEGLKVHKCAVCNKVFNRANTLKKHAMSHSTLKPFRCTVCTKSFNRKDHLSQHQQLHERQNLFVCDICQRTFNSVNYLRKHKASKHSTEEKNDQHSKKFLCSECGQQFLRKDYLVVHMRRHRGEKPFKCKYCGKGFPRSTDLTVHERYHTGEKIHLCTICGRGFGRAYNFTIHMRTHTGDKPYQCTYCEATFAQGGDLKIHVKRNTGRIFQCAMCTESFLMGCTLKQHKRTVHGHNVISNIKLPQPIHKQENPDEPPSITIPKPFVPENVTFS